MRIVFILLLLVIMIAVNVIIYLKQKSAYQKYDDILDKESEDVIASKKFTNGEFGKASQILRNLHDERKKQLNSSPVAIAIRYFSKFLQSPKHETRKQT